MDARYILGFESQRIEYHASFDLGIPLKICTCYIYLGICIILYLFLMESLNISIVVPSYNGKEKVLRLLHALEKQTYLSFEVIVVLDGSTDGSANAINSNNWTAFPLKVIEQKNNGRASARNTGVSHISTEHILFFDDDMVPFNTCIQEYMHFFQQHNNVIALGQIIEPASKNDSEIKKYKDHLNTQWNEELSAYKQNIIPDSMTVLAAANVALSASLFKELSGFDQRLKDIEDYDFALRAKQAGIKTYYVDSAIAKHQDDFSFQKYAERSKAYLKNRILAKKQNPDLYKNDNILNHQHGLLLQLLYKLFKFHFWLYMFDSWNIFQLMVPKKVRYKLYGIAITAYIHNQDK
jgi:GT2 family glycosyltransferase